MNGVVTRREDIFLSIGITGDLSELQTQSALVALTRLVDRHFRFWELLLVSDVDAIATHRFATTALANVRLLKVRAKTNVFQQRLCIAREAIGNVLLMTIVDELDQFVVPDLIETAERSQSIVTLRRRENGLFNPALVAFGRSAGFRVDLRDLMTVAYPRDLLDRVLQHPDAPLALRFPPVDTSLPITVVLCDAKRASRSGAVKRIGYRLNILRKLLVSSAPRVLSAIELVSLLVTVSAFAFATYATIIWLTLKTVEPGWFSTSLILSMIAMFLSASIFALAMGLERLLDLLAGDRRDELVDEVNSIDVFESVVRELNIDFDAGAGRQRAAPSIES